MSRYLIARYIKDLARMEPRNIGVILFPSDGHVLARFLGEKKGDLDLRVVRSQVTHTQTYRQWIDYWRYTMHKSSIKEVADKILASSRGNYQVTEGRWFFCRSKLRTTLTASWSICFNYWLPNFRMRRKMRKMW